jgi:hypothetical protein
VSTLERELEARAADGLYPSTIKHISSVLALIGYKLDRSDDCRHTARYMTGPRAGESYPCITTGLTEIDTGARYAHFASRRDANFERLQELRRAGTLFAVVRGAILDL